MEQVVCPICETDQARPWGREFKGHTIVKSPRCGLRYVSPRRTAGENAEIYDDEHYFARMAGDQQHLAQLENYFLTNLKTFRTFLPFCNQANPRILDVGTGTGFFLMLAKMMGFHRLAGADLTGVNREQLERFGIPLLAGDIVDMPAERIAAQTGPENGGFDLITLLHVLEHVMDPNAFLGKLHELLAPGGLLYVLVPNEGNLPSAWKSLISRAGLKKRAFKHLLPGTSPVFLHPLHPAQPAGEKRVHPPVHGHAQPGEEARDRQQGLSPAGRLGQPGRLAGNGSQEKRLNVTIRALSNEHPRRRQRGNKIPASLPSFLFVASGGKLSRKKRFIAICKE